MQISTCDVLGVVEDLFSSGMIGACYLLAAISWGSFLQLFQSQSHLLLQDRLLFALHVVAVCPKRGVTNSSFQGYVAGRLHAASGFFVNMISALKWNPVQSTSRKGRLALEF